MKFTKYILSIALFCSFYSCVKEESDPEIVDSFLFGTETYSPAEDLLSLLNISENDLESVVREDFDSNIRSWFVGNEINEYEADIEDGNYLLRNYNNNRSYWYPFNLTINSSRNFQVSSIISFDELNQGDGGVGLMIGTEEYYFGLVYNKDLEVAIILLENDELSYLKDYSQVVDMNDVFEEQHLIIRKYNGYYYFFINENYIGSFLQENTLNPGSRMAFLNGAGTKIKIELLYIDYINI